MKEEREERYDLEYILIDLQFVHWTASFRSIARPKQKPIPVTLRNVVLEAVSFKNSRRVSSSAIKILFFR